ncbi:MAG: ice-binding family protein, partial [bacterium]
MKKALAITGLATAMLVTAAKGGFPELPVFLGSAGDFVILAKTGISTVPNSDITGDMGVSPIFATAITGFSLIMDSSGEFSTSTQVTGKIYAKDYMVPTPTKMTTAISNMETAYTDAAGRTIPNNINLGAIAGGDRDIGGLTLTPGLHTWSTGVLISTDVWLDAAGNPDAVFIFQIAGDLTLASYKKVILSGGAQAKNIFWQVAGGAGAIIGTYSHFEGVILAQTAINVRTGASFNGKLLAQTDVNLDQNNIMDANLIPPPEVQLEIVSAHGTGTPATGVYVNVIGSLLTNSITPVATMGGTQYVATGWSMTGNAPASGSGTNMVMVQTNSAVLT